MSTAKISSKGQIAIPAALRDAIDLRPGSKVSFELLGKAIVLRPVPRFDPVTPRQGLGCAGYRGPRISQSAIKQAARKWAARKWRRRSAD